MRGRVARRRLMPPSDSSCAGWAGLSCRPITGETEAREAEQHHRPGRRLGGGGKEPRAEIEGVVLRESEVRIYFNEGIDREIRGSVSRDENVACVVTV